MQRKQLFDNIVSQLSAIYNPQEARAISLVLFEEILSLSKSDIFIDYATPLESTPDLMRAVDELMLHRPLQYVLGRAWFCDMIFSVAEGVLIPRPETEELVRWITADCGVSKRILDIGTGSGCIAVSLAKLVSEARVWAMDISETALEIAKTNALQMEVDVEFMLCDILSATPQGQYDVIVSNPPYVVSEDKELMRNNVLDYEPHLALFAPDDDNLIFYRKIADYATHTLSDGGRLYFEINEGYADETSTLLRDRGFHTIEVRKDIFDKNRMIRAIWR